jgi:hypothetical protein
MLLRVYIVPGLRQAVPTERMLSRLTGVAAPFRVVAVAPCVAVLGHFTEAAALA